MKSARQAAKLPNIATWQLSDEEALERVILARMQDEGDVLSFVGSSLRADGHSLVLVKHRAAEPGHHDGARCQRSIAQETTRDCA